MVFFVARYKDFSRSKEKSRLSKLLVLKLKYFKFSLAAVERLASDEQQCDGSNLNFERPCQSLISAKILGTEGQ